MNIPCLDGTDKKGGGSSNYGVDVGANIVRGLTLSEVSSIRHITPGLYRYHPMQGGMGGRQG